MATISGSSYAIAKGVIRTRWGPFTATSDVGTPICSPQLPDKTARAWATGNLFFGADLIVEGSSASGSNYDQLTAASGAVLAFTTTDSKVIQENPKWIRPRMTSATANTNRRIYFEIISQSAKR